ncbi:heterokaryon incompatibility protein-domain-containing protein [Xylaria telfairii]|nr:heterokaryon incompatibility protein-domain-containing protein [Xylaria telfairii]
MIGTGLDSIGDLPIFADLGTPAARVFSETWTTTDRNPEAHVDFARHWMDECHTHHKLCSSPFFDSGPGTEMPTRLIDVSGDTVRLVTAPAQAPYVALSYCWGKSMQATTSLRPSNLQALHIQISEAELPKTHTDAFAFARVLGFRYVWIDALCIVQGDAQDWARESRRMALVYGNAGLTIIAGRAADSRDGFLANRLRQATQPCAIPFYDEEATRGFTGGKNGEAAGSIWVSLPRSSLEGPVAERGWCFQESMLSQRAVIFGEEQLHFQCRELRVREDGGVKRALPYRIRNAADRKYSSLPVNAGFGGSSVDDEREVTRRWLIFWYDTMLRDYTKRSLTNASDIFAALSGMAQVAKTKIRSRYLAGLWECDMVRGLLWRPWHARSLVPWSQAMCERRVPTPHTGQEEVPPSWSWAAVRGQVQVNAVNRKEMEYHESNWLVRPKYENVGCRWTRDPTCHATEVHIRSCELEFFGRPRRVRCEPYQHPSELDMTMPDEVKVKKTRQRAAMVFLTPDEIVAAPGEANHTVARALFDVVEERVSNCWCIPLTKKAGLLLLRDEDGRFRRLGTMEVRDLDWMMAGREEEICLV